MVNYIFLFAGSLLPLFWGIAHLFPTKSVVKDFGNISTDNKHIITMEWVIEGVSLIFIGSLVAGITLINKDHEISRFVYAFSASGLLVLAIISLFTGFRVNFLPFKLCPLIFTSSALFILLGIIL